MKTNIKKVFEVDHPIDLVWNKLSNPEEIVNCVPGAEIIEKIDDRNYKGKVVTKFGPVKAKYHGHIEIIEMDYEAKKMILKGKGLDSKGKGSADMVMEGTLAEMDHKTVVNFGMEITITGMLAQFGARLINDVSDQMVNQFIENFRKLLSGQEIDNTMKAGSVLGTVVKSVFGKNKSS
jgi:carbon monoxide dehydrogenase subunit G